jgi:hypothetical protein
MPAQQSSAVRLRCAALIGLTALASIPPSVHATDDISSLSLKQLKRMLKERGERCHGCTDKTEYIAKANEVVGLPALYKLDADAEKAGWGRGGEQVAHLAEATFDAFIGGETQPAAAREGDGAVLLLFHGWGCKAAKPAFSRLAAEVTEAAAAVDCSDPAAKAVCSRFKARAARRPARSRPPPRLPRPGTDVALQSFPSTHTPKFDILWMSRFFA